MSLKNGINRLRNVLFFLLKIYIHFFVKFFCIFYLTLPNDHHLPTKFFEFFTHLFVSCDVFFELGIPELCSAFGCVGVFAALVAMPEAAVDEDHGFVLRQYDVRLAWQIFFVKTETVAHSMQQRPDNHFRFGVAVPDP